MSIPACIVITAWNQVEKTVACLRTATAQTYPNYTIVLVDNGSDAALAETIIREFPQAVILTNAQNLGFAAGYNVGLRYGLEHDFDLFLILNNDTLLAPDCLQALVNEAMIDSHVGLVTAKIYYAHDCLRIWTVGNHLRPWLLDITDGGQGQVDIGQWEQPREIDFAPFCGMLVKRSVLEQVGLLDEKFFLYYEDMDYCRRARLSGFRLRMAPEATIWHEVSTSSGGRDSPSERFWMAQSSGRYFRKHGQNWRMFFILPFRLASALKMTGRLLLKRRWRALLGYWRGLIIGWSTGQATTPPAADLLRADT